MIVITTDGKILKTNCVTGLSVAAVLLTKEDDREGIAVDLRERVLSRMTDVPFEKLVTLVGELLCAKKNDPDAATPGPREVVENGTICCYDETRQLWFIDP